MNLPFWLLRLLPMWDWICPSCRKTVKQKSHKCAYCGENYGVPLRVLPRVLKDPKALEKYVHESIFPKISAKQREYLTQFFTTLFSDGFESGNFDAWTTSSADVGCSASVVPGGSHHGTYKAEFYVDGAAPGQYANSYKDLTNSSELYVRAYYKFLTSLCVANSAFRNICSFTSGGNTLARLRIGHWTGGPTDFWELNYLKNGGFNSIIVSPPAPELNAWHCLEVHCKRDAVAGAVDFYLDGVNIASDSGFDNTLYLLINELVVGEAYNSEAVANTIEVDCVVVADARINCEKIPIMNLKPRGGDARSRLEFNYNLKRPPIK